MLEPFESDFTASGLARARLLASSARTGPRRGHPRSAFAAWDEGDSRVRWRGCRPSIGEANDPERRDLLRRVMVAIFTELGADDPLAREHRRRLAAALACFLKESLPERRTVQRMQGDPSSLAGVFAALVAGIVSFLSPCVLPLVPGYLSAVTGVSVAELEDAGWRKVLAPRLIFIASFSVIFILLGLTAIGLGRSAAAEPGPAREDRRRPDHRHGRALRRPASSSSG